MDVRGSIGIILIDFIYRPGGIDRNYCVDKVDILELQWKGILAYGLGLTLIARN
jgi:hypothetical protein